MTINAITGKESVASLGMEVEVVEGVYILMAPWLTAPVSAKTFEEAYDKAIRLRRRR